MKTPPDGWDDNERDLPVELADTLSNLRHRATTLPIEVLRAAGAGVLPKDLDDGATGQLASDRHVRETIEQLNDSAELDAHTQARLFDRITREGSVSAPRRAALPWRAAIAAAAVLAVAASLFWLRDRQPPSTLAPNPQAAIVEPPARTSMPAPQPESFLLPLERPDVRISLRSMTWRGSERRNPVLAAMKPALDAFRSGDYQRADTEFSVLGKAYPNLVEVGLYQGVSRIFLRDLAGARASLQSAATIGDQSFVSDIEWYLAIVDERSGDAAGARARISRLCPNGIGDPRACTALARP